MKKQIIAIIAAVVACAFLFAAPVYAASQETCPVMGGKIDKKIYADHDGKRVYFCCAQCNGEFKKDPAKFVKKLEDGGIELDKVPAPVKETKP
ncbi:MAG: YHS domain-containing protein [bacterium]|nr:YHS domain-containing protein [bacterium]